MAPHGSIIIYDGPSKTIISFSSGPHLGLGWTSTHTGTMVKVPELFFKVASNHGKDPIMIHEAEGTTSVWVLVHPDPVHTSC